MPVSHSLYPAFLQLQGKKVLIVGGGTVAERKVRALLATHAQIWVGAPELTPALTGWANDGSVKWLQGVFEPGWMEHVWLVIAATDDRQVNATVHDLALSRQIWINVVDDPELAEFQVPAVVDRAPLTIAISSGGHAPVLARRLRERLESLVDHGMGKLAGLLAGHRPDIRTAYPDLAQRRRFYDWTLDGPLLQLVSSGDEQAALRLLKQALQAPEHWPDHMLTLLAAPLEDPGLLTLKGLRALHEADALLYDPDLHTEALLAMARRDAERLPLHLDQWLDSDQIQTTLQGFFQEHGRIVALVPPPCNARSLDLATLFSRLEKQGLPVLRI